MKKHILSIILALALILPVTGGLFVTDARAAATDLSTAEAYPSLNYRYVMPVYITKQPEAVKTAAGKTVEFVVCANGGTMLSYQWQFSKDGGKTWKDSALTCVSTALKSTLQFTATKAKNGYRYRCVVRNSEGAVTTSESARLTVRWKPVITTQPAARSVTAGKTAGFTVEANGGGLKYQWQVSKDGGSTWKNVISSNSTAKTKTLSLKTSKKMSGYRFRCIVRNIAGKTTTRVVRLTVK